MAEAMTKMLYRARRHGDFLRVYYDDPIYDVDW